jgi:hypothetical protein
MVHALAEKVREPLLTCEAVLAETAFHLKDSALTLKLVETGLVRLAFDMKIKPMMIASPRTAARADGSSIPL